MLEKLMESPIAWAVLAIIAIVSFIYAIVCQQKNKEKKEISYLKVSNELIRKKKVNLRNYILHTMGKQLKICV